jgi:hypothetical protein
MRQMEREAVPTATGPGASTRGGPHDWPMDRPPTGRRRRPWIFSAKGYLEVLFKDSDEARRAQRGLQERGVPAGDMRLYVAVEVLSKEARFLAGRSWLAKVVNGLTADREARRPYFANAGQAVPHSGSTPRPGTTPTGFCGSSPTTTSPTYGMTATRVWGR